MFDVFPQTAFLFKSAFTHVRRDRVRCFEIIIHMTESGNFPFRPCGEGQHFWVAQELYSDRKTCFVGRFPPDDAQGDDPERASTFGLPRSSTQTGKTCFVGRFPPDDECLLFVNNAFKDSFPEECERQFDRLCGGNKYALYGGRNCTQLG
ncbi:hypothetical protein HPB48_012290 [Haemaphysalis longicornis]|uniref:Uncharacterized protein n=1 Tax=Haemaphysalis longicornis TaxID=44386 RepID=A0A9J6GNE4_HAELO|nr:hypothetical protein HPB48_012290 [Haemaphysalis longicornis]